MIEEKILAKIVGAGNVSCEQTALDGYATDMSFVNKVMPDYVVKPGNTDDVVKIVKFAKGTLTPLVPVSSGPPHFRGDTVPSTGGAVMVDLHGMKKIIRVDRLNRVVMVEPGVTFGELIPAVTKEGLRLNMPLLPRKSKSVMASMLEREPVLMPGYHWDISDPLNCIEIVFGTGDMFRTGAAAGPGTIEEQWAAGGAQVEAAGPTQFSLHRLIQGSQGTMGIVTWASARCELLPELEKPFLVGSSLLDKILDMVHWLIRLRLVNECLVLNSSNLAAIMTRKWPGDYHRVKAQLPPWVLFYNIAGYKYLPEKRVSVQVQDMMDVAQREGVHPVQTIGRVIASELLQTIQRPSDEPYWKLRSKGACEDIFFITINDKITGLIAEMYSMAEKVGYPTSDIGIYLQPIVQGVNCHCEFNLFYDPEDPVEVNKVRELASSGSIKKLMNKGAFFSRPYGEATDTIYGSSSTSTITALKKVKSILDPNNIMNAGKLCF
jgi:FAD/FMN-containing dehydrogenase